MKRLSDLGGFIRRHRFFGAFLVTLAVLIVAEAAFMFPLNSITAHRWTHSLPVALLVVGVFAAAQLANIVANIVDRQRGWSIAAALATAAVMVWISVRVWMGIPRSGNATLDATLLMVLLTPTATTSGLAAVGAKLAKDVIEKWLPAMDQPWRAG